MKKLLFIAVFSIITIIIKAQEIEQSNIHGNFQLDAQTYGEDSIIGAVKADEIMLMHAYANFIYTKGKFSAGTRFEGYMNTLQGFLPVNEGVGFPYRWAKYTANNLEITVGSYYEQFGSGLIFRSYEERTLGYDNAMDGLRIKYHIGTGITIKAIYGQQRVAQKYVNGTPRLIKGRGIVRGIDGDFSINDVFASLSEKKTHIILGGSFVSKYEIDDDPVYKLPQNVGAGAGRINLSRQKISLMAEYVYKSMDPSASGTDNSNGNVGQSYIYKRGKGLITSFSYSQKGLGIFLMTKQIDNMNFRSERTAKLNDLSINYIPDINKNHAYTLTALYPYGTQPNGEAGFKGEIMYKFKKESYLGGHYGTLITTGYSRMNNLVKEKFNDTIPLLVNVGTIGYKSNLFNIGNELFYEDFNIEISKKINKKLKTIFTFQSVKYNNSIIHGAGEVDGIIKGFTTIADITYKFQNKKTLRTELHHFASQDDKGSWALALFEFSIPHWFFIIGDQYNYGNSEVDQRVHYYNLAVVYNYMGNRIQLGYGKQREGIVCTGGVCRRVPSANGFTISITSSF